MFIIGFCLYIRPAYNGAGPQREQLQQRIFTTGQIDRCATGCNCPLCEIECKTSYVEAVVRLPVARRMSDANLACNASNANGLIR